MIAINTLTLYDVVHKVVHKVAYNVVHIVVLQCGPNPISQDFVLMLTKMNLLNRVPEHKHVCGRPPEKN